MRKLKALLTAGSRLPLAMTGSAVQARQEPTPEMLKAKGFVETAGTPGDTRGKLRPHCVGLPNPRGLGVLHLGLVSPLHSGAR